MPKGTPIVVKSAKKSQSQKSPTIQSRRKSPVVIEILSPGKQSGWQEAVNKRPDRKQRKINRDATRKRQFIADKLKDKQIPNNALKRLKKFSQVKSQNTKQTKLKLTQKPTKHEKEDQRQQKEAEAERKQIQRAT